MPLLTPQTTNAIFNSTNYNANLVAIEGGFQDIGNYLSTGLLPSIGSGLSVNISSGTAVLGGHQAIASGVISGLADNTLNHLWIVQNLGATIFSSNTTGTPPANSAKLGTATTLAGVVTSVNTGRTSGRQQFLQPQALVPGGPAAGLTSAGHPDALNLAQWNLTDIEGKSFYGVLPAGAVPLPLGTSAFTIARAGAVSPPSPASLVVFPGADTALAAGVEAADVIFNLNRVQQFATGALATQRAIVISPPAYAFVGASTLTSAATVAITGAPVPGSFATITNPYALWIQSGRSRFDGNLETLGFSPNQVTKTTAYTVTANDFTVFCDTTTAIFTVTLPTAASVPGKILIFKRIDTSSHNLTVAAAGGDNIEGAGTAVISGGLASMWLQSNGVNTYWLIKP